MSISVSANSRISQFRNFRSDDSARFSISAWLRLDWRVVLTLVLLAAWGGASRAQAQATAQFSYVQSTIGTGLGIPEGVAVDASGDVYIASYTGADVLKETLQPDGRYKQTTIGSGWVNPINVAVDASGNVYVADVALGKVVKETPNGTSYTASTVDSGLAGLSGVAVDSSGNVYFTEGSPVSSVVVKAMPGTTAGTYTVQTIYSLRSTFYGVAVDASGNVYVADSNLEVLKLTPAGSSTPYTASTPFGSLPQVAYGVAVDGSGNVYIADGSANEVLKETLQSSGAYKQSTVVGGLSDPQGVAVDAYGDVYIGNTGNGDVLKEQTAGVNFHTVAVGSTSAAQTLTFTFTNSTAAPIKAPVVTTQGAAGLDFADTKNGTCTTNGTSQDYSSSGTSTCTVDVTFTPTKAGTRYGAVNLVDSSGAVIATAYLYGTGQGPQVAFSPATQSTVGSGWNTPEGVAVDASGNVYIADPGLGEVVKETLSNGSYTPSKIVSGAQVSNGVAVDGSGNVYFTEFVSTGAGGAGYVEKAVLGSNGTYTVNDILVLGTSTVFKGVAVDASGNVYVTVNSPVNSDSVLKLTPGSTPFSYTESTLFSGLNSPTGVAVDGSGNLYIVEAGGNDVLKETLQANGAYTQSTLVSGLNKPEGVAVDASENVYITEVSDVLKETLQSDGSYVQSTLVTGLNGPFGAAVDASGNVYIANTSAKQVLKEDFPDAPSLSFTTTTAGTTSSDSPQTVTLENIGNAALTLPPPASGQNPSISANFTLDNTATCPLVYSSGSPATLAAGSSCTLPVDFTPQTAGSFSGTLAITDNNLNAASPSYATQSISLSGTATLATTTTTLSAPSTAYYGAPVTLSATVSSTTGGRFSGTVTFLDGSKTLGTGSVNGSGVATFTTSLLGLGAHTLTASYGGNTEYAGSTSASASLTIQAANFTLTIAGGSASITPGQNASFPVTVTPEGKLSSPISFQCSTSNADIGCTVTPGSVTLGTSSTSVTLQVQTSGSVAALPFGPGNPWNRWGWPLAALGLLPLLGLGLLTKFRLIPQRVQRLAWASVLATGLALGLAACGSPVNATQATSAGSYTASITGTSGSQTVTQQVSVTVK